MSPNFLLCPLAGSDLHNTLVLWSKDTKWKRLTGLDGRFWKRNARSKNAETWRGPTRD